MTLEELETLEKYNIDKTYLDREMQEKLDSLDNFRKNISTDNGVTIYFTIESECAKRRTYDNICNPVYSMLRTSNMHEELDKMARVRAKKLIDLIIDKCKEEKEQKLANLDAELKSNLEK